MVRLFNIRENIAAILKDAADRKKANNYQEALRLEKLAAKVRILGYLQEPYPEAVVGFHMGMQSFNGPTDARGVTFTAVSPYTAEITGKDKEDYDLIISSRRLAARRQEYRR